MNGYDLSRNFWNWAFDNPEKVTPALAAIYFFAVEHCNRLGDKEKFGFPSQMTMDAVGISKHQTYMKYFNQLVEYGFIELVQKSKNQYSSNIISIVQAVPKKGKALDKAFIKHGAKQTESTGQSTYRTDGYIDKQYNKEQYNKEQYNNDNEDDYDPKAINDIEVDEDDTPHFHRTLKNDLNGTTYSAADFLSDWNDLREKHLKKKSFLNQIPRYQRDDFRELSKNYDRDDFRNALEGLFRQKKLPNGNKQMQSNPSHFLTHFNTYLTAYHDRTTDMYGKPEKVNTL
ncbi:MAG TPA: hypothetical protein VFM69_06470 [Pricia sp.]|nr:hypothetical protein [Pricia sp.]